MTVCIIRVSSVEKRRLAGTRRSCSTFLLLFFFFFFLQDEAQTEVCDLRVCIRAHAAGLKFSLTEGTMLSPVCACTCVDVMALVAALVWTLIGFVWVLFLSTASLWAEM